MEHTDQSKKKGKRAESKFVNINDLRKDPVQWQKLMSIIDDGITIRGKVAELKQQAKENTAFAVEEVNIDPKIFKVLLDVAYNNDGEERKAKMEVIDDAIDAFMSAIKWGGQTAD
jgi:hypothetical protein